MIQHIVLFTPKPGLTREARRAFAAQVLATLRSSAHIARATVGRSISVDPGYQRSFGDKTYEYAAVLEFEAQSDLVSYLNHPEHAKLGRAFWETCDSTIICETDVVDIAADAAEDILVE